ncbi:MAG: UDP-glycosyltransferase [Planctomycetes bacterium]|nr:UDP-glycosyltransferase [Planctomycetota bacterium]
MAKALFTAYGGAHVAMILPVLRELRRRGGWETSVLGLTTAGAVLDAAGIPFLGFKDLVRPGDEKALASGAELAGSHHTDGVGVSREESIAYLGLSYADLRERVGTDEARSRVAAIGRRAFLPLGPLRRVMERTTPDVVVTTNSPRSEEASIRVAKERGVPSVCMVPFAAPELIAQDTVSAHVREPGFADRVLVFGEDVRRWLVAQGRRPEEIVVTGNPAFENLGDPALPARAAGWRKQRGLDGRKLILWASSPEPARPALLEETLSALLAALPRHPDWHLIYRRHPSEPFLPVPLHERSSHSDGRDPLEVLLHAVDAVVVTVSTVGIEAALAGKPLVKVCLSRFDAISPYETMGIALPVRRIDELEGQVERALGDGPESKALAAARRRYPPVGDAARNVADVLEQLA